MSARLRPRIRLSRLPGQDQLIRPVFWPIIPPSAAPVFFATYNRSERYRGGARQSNLRTEHASRRRACCSATPSDRQTGFAILSTHPINTRSAQSMPADAPLRHCLTSERRRICELKYLFSTYSALVNRNISTAETFFQRKTG